MVSGGGGEAEGCRGGLLVVVGAAFVAGLPLATLSSDDDSESDSEEELDESEEDDDSACFVGSTGTFWGCGFDSSPESESEESEDEDDSELEAALRFLLRFLRLGTTGLPAGGGIFGIFGKRQEGKGRSNRLTETLT